jgi:exodeoxyribonuclease VII large subunit
MNGAAFAFVPPQKAERPYTITEINQGVQAVIEAGNTLVWAEGEISNFKRASSGHCYLKLKDALSQVPAVMWKNVADDLAFTPEDGMQVIVIATLRVYTKGGYYQLDLHKMQPAGLGALHIAFEKLKLTLEAEGLFDPARKRPLPEHVSTLGVITSKQGAAIRDIVKVAFSRSPRIDIVLMDVPVQGEMAAEKIARAIDDMNAYGKVDCIIVGRGGGSIEDLWAFNEEVVARAIFKSAIPVISAIGHEIDFTISDFVADVRAPTPSAAAEIAVADDEHDRRYFLARARQLTDRFFKCYSNAKNTYQNLTERPGLIRVAGIVREARQTTDTLSDGINRSFYHVFKNFTERTMHASSRLNALSPLNTMARGYSVVSNAGGKAIKSASQALQGDRVDIRFFKGKATAEIKESVE